MEAEDICERSKGVYEGCKGVCGRLMEVFEGMILSLRE